MLMGIKKLNILFWDYNKLENVLGYLHVLTFQDTEYAHLFNTSIEDLASLVTKHRHSWLWRYLQLRSQRAFLESRQSKWFDSEFPKLGTFFIIIYNIISHGFCTRQFGQWNDNHYGSVWPPSATVDSWFTAHQFSIADISINQPVECYKSCLRPS